MAYFHDDVAFLDQILSIRIEMYIVRGRKSGHLNGAAFIIRLHSPEASWCSTKCLSILFTNTAWL